MHVAVRAGDVTVLVSDLADRWMRLARRPPRRRRGRGDPVAREAPVIEARPTFAVVGDRDIRVSVFTPGGSEPDAPLPVLLDPYGGPHFSGW